MVDGVDPARNRALRGPRQVAHGVVGVDRLLAQRVGHFGEVPVSVVRVVGLEHRRGQYWIDLAGEAERAMRAGGRADQHIPSPAASAVKVSVSVLPLVGDEEAVGTPLGRRSAAIIPASARSRWR